MSRTIVQLVTVLAVTLAIGCGRVDDVDRQPDASAETDGGQMLPVESAPQAIVLGSINTDDVAMLPQSPCGQFTGEKAWVNIYNNWRMAWLPHGGNTKYCAIEDPGFKEASMWHALYMARHKSGPPCQTSDQNYEEPGCPGYYANTGESRVGKASQILQVPRAAQGPLWFSGALLTYNASPASTTPYSTAETFALWINDLFHRHEMMRYHGGFGVGPAAGFSRQKLTTNGGFTAEWAHSLHEGYDWADTNHDRLPDGQANEIWTPLVVYWPPAGNIMVPTKQYQSVAQVPDPNGNGSVGYALTMSAFEERQNRWRIQRMCFDHTQCQPGQPCWECADEDYDTKPGGGPSGYPKVLTNADYVTIPTWASSFYTPDAMTPNRRYRATVWTTDNFNGVGRKREWEFKTKP